MSLLVYVHMLKDDHLGLDTLSRQCLIRKLDQVLSRTSGLEDKVDELGHRSKEYGKKQNIR